MFVILWEFEVKPGCEQSFESAYGPEGAWTQLFRRDPGYLKTLLLKDASRTRLPYPRFLALRKRFPVLPECQLRSLSSPRSFY
jgi:hypothetical protein